MNRAHRKQKKWFARHISDPPLTFGFEGETEEQNQRAKELVFEFLNNHPPGKEAKVAGGVLGETKPSHLFVKEEVRPESGGVRLKFYGVDYFLRGHPKEGAVFGLEMSKSNLFQFPFQFLRIPLFFLSSVLLLLFSRKTLYKLLYWELYEIHWKVTRHYDPVPKDYNEFGWELKRVVHNALFKVFGIDNEKVYYPLGHERFSVDKAYPDADRLEDKFLGWCVALFTRFVITFLEIDFAYRFRFQDVFGTLNKKDVYEDAIKELFRILDLLMARETKFALQPGMTHGLANVLKWKRIRSIFRLGFFFEPKLKEYITEILKNIDVAKVRMDENDWYFCLGYSSYDFGGKPYGERMKIRKELDIKHNHTYWVLWNRVK